MLVMQTVEGRTGAICQLPGGEQAVGFHYPSLPCTHLGSIGLSHGLFFGSRQLMILTPLPLALTRRLWEAIHSRTSLEVCQLALSQIKTQTLLPATSSFWQHHLKNCVVTLLTGRPSTNLSHIFSSSGT